MRKKGRRGEVEVEVDVVVALWSSLSSPTSLPFDRSSQKKNENSLSSWTALASTIVLLTMYSSAVCLAASTSGSSGMGDAREK